jgi:hypothetical protein
MQLVQCEIQENFGSILPPLLPALSIQEQRWKEEMGVDG